MTSEIEKDQNFDNSQSYDDINEAISTMKMSRTLRMIRARNEILMVFLVATLPFTDVYSREIRELCDEKAVIICTPRPLEDCSIDAPNSSLHDGKALIDPLAFVQASILLERSTRYLHLEWNGEKPEVGQTFFVRSTPMARGHDLSVHAICTSSNDGHHSKETWKQNTKNSKTYLSTLIRLTDNITSYAVEIMNRNAVIKYWVEVAIYSRNSWILPVVFITTVGDKAVISVAFQRNYHDGLHSNLTLMTCAPRAPRNPEGMDVDTSWNARRSDAWGFGNCSVIKNETTLQEFSIKSSKPLVFAMKHQEHQLWIDTTYIDASRYRVEDRMRTPTFGHTALPGSSTHAENATKDFLSLDGKAQSQQTPRTHLSALKPDVQVFMKGHDEESWIYVIIGSLPAVTVVGIILILWRTNSDDSKTSSENSVQKYSDAFRKQSRACQFWTPSTHNALRSSKENCDGIGIFKESTETLLFIPREGERHLVKSAQSIMPVCSSSYQQMEQCSDTDVAASMPLSVSLTVKSSAYDGSWSRDSPRQNSGITKYCANTTPGVRDGRTVDLSPHALRHTHLFNVCRYSLIDDEEVPKVDFNRDCLEESMSHYEQDHIQCGCCDPNSVQQSSVYFSESLGIRFPFWSSGAAGMRLTENSTNTTVDQSTDPPVHRKYINEPHMPDGVSFSVDVMDAECRRCNQDYEFKMSKQAEEVRLQKAQMKATSDSECYTLYNYDSC